MTNSACSWQQNYRSTRPVRRVPPPVAPFHLQVPASTRAQVSTLGPRGSTTIEGLFAAMDINEGSVVARMETCTTGSRAEWLEHRRECGLPEYACVEVEVGRRAVTYWDSAFIDVAKPPVWYKMNHSCRPNASCKLDKDHRPCFVATEFIPRGNEIMFKYSSDHGEFPMAWCNCLERAGSTGFSVSPQEHRTS